MKLTKPIKIYKREALLIRRDKVPPKLRSQLKEDYTFRFYNEKSCQKCEFLVDRHSDICDQCAAYMGGAQLAKDVVLRERKYISLPIGDTTNVEHALNRAGIRNYEFINKHPESRLKKKIKFTGKLRDYQPDAVKAIIERKKGILEAPPRSGKTIMGTAAICKLGRKTLILASQRDWLLGFYETFCGSKTQKALTTAKGSGPNDADTRQYLKTHKRANVGFCRTLDQFQRHDICLATVQTFYSASGQKLLRKLRDEFSVMVVDEIHTGAATKYASILAKLNTEWTVGLTGTPDRKDGKWVLMEKLIGKPLYQVKVERLKPTVRLVRTEFKDRGGKQWATLVNQLESDPKRLKLIAKHALQDVNQGHMVLIPMARVKCIKALTMAINRLAGEDIAEAFYGGVKKEKRSTVIEKARKYKVKVIVGQSKLISTGINIPRASAIYDVSYSSNIPNCIQRVSRILTPWEDKPPPLLRIFLDDTNVRKACLRNEWWQCMKPKFKPIISEKDNIVLSDYLSNKERQEVFEW